MLALPFAGAALGGFAAAGTAYIGMAMSVGWMVGSWLMGPQQGKNDIVDPGAQEMPRWNQALRGATMAVAFGTNRMPSHIVWQSNFTTERNETNSGGGGKLGGSGGGKGAPSSGSISYQYKWDVVYHVGMFPIPYQVFGGWLAGNRLAAEVIVAIQSDSSAAFSPYAQFMLNQQSPVEDDAAFISFDQGIWWPGGSEEEGWDHLETNIGQPIRWPWTGYIGLKQLDLGENPHIPQLEWEVGPGSFSAECGDDAVVGANSTTLDAISHISNYEVDVYGRAYGYDKGDSIVCFERDGTLAWKLSGAQIRTRWDAIYSMTMVSQPSNPQMALIRLDDGHEYVVIYGYIATDAGGGGQPWNHLEICEITAEGSTDAPANLAAIRWQNQINAEMPHLAVIRLGNIIVGFEEHIALTIIPNTNLDAEYWISPPISEIVLGTFDAGYTAGTHVWETFEVPNYRTAWANDSNPNDVDFRWEDYSMQYHNQDISRPGWYLEEIDPTDGSITVYRHWYKGWATMTHAINEATQPQLYLENVLGGTYPNGVMLRVEFTSIAGYHTTVDSLLGSNNFVLATDLPDPTVINDSWVDETGASVIPFDNINTLLSTGDPDPATDGFDYGELPLVKRLESGVTILIFEGASLSQTDANPDLDEQVIVNMRLFFHDPITGVITQFAELQCDAGNSTDGWGNSTTPTEYRTGLIMPWFSETDYKLYIYALTIQGEVLINDWGDISLTTGDDVLPPYIIHEIMTNPVFGIGIPTSDIEAVSYQASLDYCSDQGFKLSVQYRREQSWIRVVEELLETYGGYLTISGGKIKFGIKTDTANATPVRVLDNNHFLVEADGEAPVNISKGAAQDTFNKVRVNYIDRALDYRQNQVEISDEVDQDLTGIRMREFPAQYVMSEKFARTIAARTMWANRYGRDKFSFKLGWKDSDLEPGDVVTLVDSHYPFMNDGINARIVQWIERTRGVYEVMATEEIEHIFTAVQSAFNISSGSIAPGPGPIPKILNQWVYELPNKFQLTNSVVYASYVPDALAYGAVAYASPDGATYQRIKSESPMPISGILLTDLADSNRTFVEDAVEIVLFPNSDWAVGSETFVYSTTLGEVSEATRAAGGGLLWVGSEMLAYEGVNLVSQNRYRFARLYRGWGGTHIHDHSSGDYFSKHGGGIFSIPYNEAQIGQNLYVKIAPMNFAGLEADLSSITAVQYSIQGTNYRPQIAPQPRLIVGSEDYRGCYKIGVASSADITMDWRDSSRNSGHGMGGYGVSGFGRFAIDVLSHSWRVEIVGSGDIIVRSLEVTTATYTYPGSTNAADNGDWRGNVAFRVTPFGEYGDATRTEVASLEVH